jgi:hypothetical protein
MPRRSIAVKLPLVNLERITMRALLAALAIAGAIAAGCVAARAQVMADARYPVAMMSASDVIRALRCAPPFGCKQQRSKPQRANAPFSFGFAGLHPCRLSSPCAKKFRHNSVAVIRRMPFAGSGAA